MIAVCLLSFTAIIIVVFYNNNGFVGLEDLAIWLFLTEDLFDLPGAGGKSFLWPGGDWRLW